MFYVIESSFMQERGSGAFMRSMYDLNAIYCHMLVWCIYPYTTLLLHVALLVW